MATPIFGRGFLLATDATSGITDAFGVLQEVSVEMKFDDEDLLGQNQVAAHSGRKKTGINGKAKNASIDGALFRRIAYPQLAKTAATATLIPVPDESYTVATTVTITSLADVLLIVDQNGAPAKKVSGAPAAAGEYQVSGTSIIHHASDVGKTWKRTYVKTAASELGTYKLTNAVMQTTPYFRLDVFNITDGRCLYYKFPRVKTNSINLLEMKDSWSMPVLDFQVMADPTSGDIYTVSEGTWA